MIRTLAEPNLTAISGESANFLAGGEFPIPGGYTCDPTDAQLPGHDRSSRSSASASTSRRWCWRKAASA